MYECPMYLALRAVYCHCVARLDRELLSSEADGVAAVTRDDGDPRNENGSPVEFSRFDDVPLQRSNYSSRPIDHDGMLDVSDDDDGSANLQPKFVWWQTSHLHGVKELGWIVSSFIIRNSTVN